MNPKISVVVPTYNRSALLGLCLAALEKQSLEVEKFEVIVVDDGSNDSTVDLLKSCEGSCRTSLTWHQQPHAGPSAARNRGLEYARGNWIAFTDDDCIPDPHWLADLVAAIPADRKCGGIGGPVRRVRDNLVGRYIDRELLMTSWIENGLVEYLITANAFVRAEALREIGGFSNDLGRTARKDFGLGGGEDADMGYRLRRAGYYLIMIEGGVIYHHHHDSLKEFYTMCWRHGYGAGLLSGHATEVRTQDLRKFAVLKKLIRILIGKPTQPQYGVWDAVTWRALATTQAIANFNGHRSCLRDLNRYLEQASA